MTELDSGDKQLLRSAFAKLAAAQDLLQFVTDHFRDKYHLEAHTQITPQGEILIPTVFDSDLQEKEKLNGTPSDNNINAESERQISESPTVSDL